MALGTFTKTKRGVPPRFFDREALGLRTLAEAGARVPEVVEVGPEHIVITRVPGLVDSSRRTPESEEAFGRELAALHRTTGERFGSLDGEPTAYLGDWEIDLTPADDWHTSWVWQRVVPLTRQAVERGALDPTALADAEAIGADTLGPSEPPTLVHGDLWAGNRLVDDEGRSWLIDPSAHWGHREVDLAMMHLFGGFSGRVFAAYAEELPLADGWRDRIPLHQTVPLLVHTLLFGGGYAVQAAEALRLAARRG